MRLYVTKDREDNYFRFYTEEPRDVPVTERVFDESAGNYVARKRVVQLRRGYLGYLSGCSLLRNTLQKVGRIGSKKALAIDLTAAPKTRR